MLERENSVLREKVSTLAFDNSVKQNMLDRLNENEINVEDNDKKTENQKETETPVYDTDFSLRQAGTHAKPSLWMKFKSVTQSYFCSILIISEISNA